MKTHENNLINSGLDFSPQLRRRRWSEHRSWDVVVLIQVLHREGTMLPRDQVLDLLERPQQDWGTHQVVNQPSVPFSNAPLLRALRGVVLLDRVEEQVSHGSRRLGQLLHAHCFLKQQCQIQRAWPLFLRCLVPEASVDMT